MPELKTSNPRVIPRSGFTLVELMVSLALIGILAGIAFPNILAYLPTFHLHSAARQVMTDLNYARGKSASLNVEYRVNFDVNADTYEVEFEKWDESTNSYIWTSDKTVNPLNDSKELGFIIEVRDSIDVKSVSQNPVYLKPTGSMTTTTITLQNSKGQELAITSSLSGRIKKGPITN